MGSEPVKLIGDIQTIIKNLNDNDVKSLSEYLKSIKLDALETRMIQDISKIDKREDYKNILTNFNNKIEEQYVEVQKTIKNSNLLTDKEKGEYAEKVKSLIQIGAKYKYFEFKYVQLNIFILTFVEKIKVLLNELANGFAQNTVQQKDTLKEIIKQLLTIMGSNMLTISDEEIKGIEGLLATGIPKEPSLTDRKSVV